MTLLRQPILVIACGALVIVLLAVVGGQLNSPAIAARLAAQAPAAIAAAGGGATVTARFVTGNGWPTRHPLLAGGDGLDEATRARVARAVGALPGAGGVRWTGSSALVQAEEVIFNPLHCQEDVQALLRARTIRFEEGSVRIDAASGSLIDEVASALRPCLGAIIAITGHTDASGPEPGNIALSGERAQAVRAALIARGIPADGLRTRGLGSRVPVEGLDPTDPANRRIDFAVIAIEPLRPTPVDTPGPR
jgi:OOP family OmpA-OmpF porin